MEKTLSSSWQLQIAAILGLTAGIIATLILQLPVRWALAVTGSFLFIPLSLLWRGARRLYLGLVVLALPLNISKTLIYHELHIGGAQALEITLADVFLGILLLIWLLELAAGQGRPVVADIYIMLPIALLAMTGIFSMVNATDISLSLFELMRIVKGILLILCLANIIRSKEDMHLVALCLVVGVGIQSLIAISQYWLGTSFGLTTAGVSQEVVAEKIGRIEFSRVGGSIGAPNALASYLVLILPVAFALLWARLNLVLTTVNVLVISVGLIALVLTLSRSAWLSLAIAILLILIAGSFRQLIKRTVAVGVIVTSITGIILVNFLLKNILWLRLVASDPESIIGRIQLMKNAWAMIKAHPLLGVGLNNFTESMMFFDPSGIMAKLFPLVPVHNIYLLIAAETGLLGLAAFLFLLWRAWRGSWLLIPKLPRFEALLCLGMIGGLITLIIHGLSDLVFRLDATLAIFWLFLSLIMALRNRPVEVWGEKSSS